jgi:hypothetical protein
MHATMLKPKEGRDWRPVAYIVHYATGTVLDIADRGISADLAQRRRSRSNDLTSPYNGLGICV